MTPTENEMTPAGAVAPNRSGVASGTIPEAVSSTTGVSLRYAPVPKGEWFVFRASYNRELKAADFILNEGIYAYVPQQYVWKEKDGKPKKELNSSMSGRKKTASPKRSSKALSPASFLSILTPRPPRNWQRTPPNSVT